MDGKCESLSHCKFSNLTFIVGNPSRSAKTPHPLSWLSIQNAFSSLFLSQAAPALNGRPWATITSEIKCSPNWLWWRERQPHVVEGNKGGGNRPHDSLKSNFWRHETVLCLRMQIHILRAFLFCLLFLDARLTYTNGILYV